MQGQRGDRPARRGAHSRRDAGRDGRRDSRDRRWPVAGGRGGAPHRKPRRPGARQRPSRGPSRVLAGARQALSAAGGATQRQGAARFPARVPDRSGTAPGVPVPVLPAGGAVGAGPPLEAAPGLRPFSRHTRRRVDRLRQPQPGDDRLGSPRAAFPAHLLTHLRQRAQAPFGAGTLRPRTRVPGARRAAGDDPRTG